MFITNPGRMGDEDGTTFIIKNGNVVTIYRISGWMYQKEDISLNDVFKQFSKWHEAWIYRKEKKYHGKYKYLYMGFGNGLSIDNSIYSEFEPYLNDLVRKSLEGRNNKEKESLKYAIIYNVWEKAFLNMVNDKCLILK